MISTHNATTSATPPVTFLSRGRAPYGIRTGRASAGATGPRKEQRSLSNYGFTPRLLSAWRLADTQALMKGGRHDHISCRRSEPRADQKAGQRPAEVSPRRRAVRARTPAGKAPRVLVRIPRGRRPRQAGRRAARRRPRVWVYHLGEAEGARKRCLVRTRSPADRCYRGGQPRRLGRHGVRAGL